MISEIKEAFLMRKRRLASAGQEMPITWKDFFIGCFLKPQKEEKRQGVQVDLDLTGI
jgi:hypothetical protein